MASLKDRVENHPVVFFLGAILVGFVSGIGAYQTILKMSDQQVISNVTVNTLNSKNSELESEITSLSKVNTSLKNQSESLSKSNFNLKNQTDRLSKNNLDLNNQITALSSEIAESPVNSYVVKQEYVRFHGVDFHGFTGEKVVKYRLVMNVDGFPFSYPGNYVWKMHGPKTPEQSFPLVANRKSHNVSIRLIIETELGNTYIAATEQGRNLTSSKGVESFNLLKETGLSSRWGVPAATVRLEITENEL